MVTRKVRTPGETPEEPTDDILDAVLGTTDETQSAKSTEEKTSDATEQTSEEAEQSPSPNLTQLLANQQTIIDGQMRIENKLDQLLKAGGVDAPKKMRWVQGKAGLEYKESK